MDSGAIQDELLLLQMPFSFDSLDKSVQGISKFLLESSETSSIGSELILNWNGLFVDFNRIFFFCW